VLACSRGSGEGASGPVRITFSGNAVGQEGELIRSQLAAFARANPGVTVESRSRTSIRRGRQHTRTELARLDRRLGVTTLDVTQDQEEAMTLGDRVAVLRDGRMEQVAPPMELYGRPATRFVTERARSYVQLGSSSGSSGS
jgi:hypothetical protein